MLNVGMDEVSPCKLSLNLTVISNTASQLIELWSHNLQHASQTSLQPKTAHAERALVAECPRAPLLLTGPLQCSELSECGVALKMTFQKTQNENMFLSFSLDGWSDRAVRWVNARFWRC